MGYITVTLNHLRAVQRWAATSGGQATLDIASFNLEVKHRNRYFRLYPMFVAMTEGRLSHVPQLTEKVVGFAGWLPYRPYEFDLAKDKLLFKRAMIQLGLPTPQWWERPQDATKDFIVKRPRGSFGLQISGPYRVGTSATDEPGSAGHADATIYGEEFIDGRILKAWFWARKPFFAHVQSYPTIVGDGVTAAGRLAEMRLLESVRDSRAHEAARAVASQCLLYQGLEASAIPRPGERAWIDFRYGRQYLATAPTATSDDALSTLTPGAALQLEQAGAAMGKLLSASLPAPVAYALDGMIDLSGRIHWLELNSNPVLPPDVYTAMFENLFG